MRLSFFSVLATLALARFAGPACAERLADAEGRKIEYLIDQVHALQGAQFVRNGVAYDGHAAADHLRLKWHAAGSHVTTAADFILLCASLSSVSGLPYVIRFADGREVGAAAFLRDKLLAYKDPVPAS